RAATASAPVLPLQRTDSCSMRSSTQRATPLPRTTMSKLRGTGWSLSIGVLAVALAAAIFQLAGAPGAVVFLALLLLAVGLVSALVGLLVELRPLAGLAGGVVAAFLVAAVLALTINLAPLGPGAQRPTWRDLFWM